MSRLDALPGPTKRRWILALTGLATIVYVATSFAVDAPRVREAISSLGWDGCGLVLALSAANYLIRFQRWQMFLARLGQRLPAWTHLLYYLCGFAFTISPAKAGEAMRSVYLREHGVSYAQSIAALFVERLQDLLAIVMLAGMMVIDRPAYRPLVGGALLLIVGLLLAASLQSVPALLQRLAPRLPSRLARGVEHLALLLLSSRQLLHPSLLLAGTAGGMLSWGGEGLGFYFICHGLHLNVDWLLALGIYALAVLAGSAAFFLPAGIGGTEVVMTALLVSQGAPLRTAVIATLLCRIATLWFAVVLGIAATASLELFGRTPKSISAT